MAARRLLIVMVILLVISTIVAALAPPPEEQGADEDDGETAARSDLDDPGWSGSPEVGGPASGAVLSRVVDLGETVPLGAPAAPIAVEAGDRLTLLVAGDRGAVISIPRLGRTETLSPSAPARFDLYLDSPGRYTVEEAESGREVATITVEEPPASPGEARDGRSRSRARARPGAEASRARR